MLKCRVSRLAPALAASAVIAPAVIRGRGLFPAGALWRIPPWTGVVPPDAGAGILSDQYLAFWPWRLYQHAHAFAAWNPLILGGVPFAGCVQAAPYYPVNLLLSWLPPVAFSWASAFLKVFAAGLFTSLFVRRLGASKDAAALSGLTFALGGFMIAWLGHPHANTACLLPALFWSLHRLSESRSLKDSAILALVTGCALLGGHPPTMIHAAAVSAAYAIFLLVNTSGAGTIHKARFCVSAAAGVLFGAMLAAPAILPFLEYLPHTSAALASDHLARWSERLPSWLLLHLVMPLASGSPALGSEVLAGIFPLPGHANFIERAAWTGLIPIVYACFAARRRGEARFFAVLAVVSLLSALGAFSPAWKSLPLFSSINPTRMLLFWTFAVAVLAGLGYDAVKPSRRGTAALIGCSALLLSLYLSKSWSSWGELLPSERLFTFKVSVLLVLEAAAAVWSLRKPSHAVPLASVFLLIPALGVNPSAPSSSLYPETPGIQALRETAGEGRVFALGSALDPDTAMPFGLRDARGRDFASPRRYEELARGKAGDFAFWSDAKEVPNPALFSIGALAATEKTRHLVPKGWKPVYAGEIDVYAAPKPAKRAHFVADARAVAPAEAFAAVTHPSFDPAKVLWLDDGPAPAPSKAKGSARFLADGSGEVRLAVESDGPGWLVLHDTHLPGWVASVNGEPAAIRRANYAFRAVAVPGGNAEVVFEYRPFSLALGVCLAAMSIILVIGLWVVGADRDRR